MTDHSIVEETEAPKRFELYRKAKLMRDDDRSLRYIANKLGFKNASSINSLLKTYGWIEALIASEVKKEHDRTWNDVTDNEKKVWLYREDLEKRLKKARLSDFEKMRSYYGRGNLKLWDEPDNNYNPVYLDDYIASLKDNQGEAKHG